MAKFVKSSIRAAINLVNSGALFPFERVRGRSTPRRAGTRHLRRRILPATNRAWTKSPHEMSPQARDRNSDKSKFVKRLLGPLTLSRDVFIYAAANLSRL